jgi:tetratricopeptide (TPR) repeat protein
MRSALRLEPGLEHGHFIMGVLLNETGQHDRAVQEYEAEVRLNPDFAAAHLNLALIFEFHRADPNRAAYHYRRYLDLGGRPVDALEEALKAVDTSD